MSLGCVGLGKYSLWGSRRRKQAESPSHWCLSITLVVQSHMIPQKKKIKTVYWPSGAICPPGSSSENWLGPFRCRFRSPLRHPKGRNGKELVPATRGDNRHLGVGTCSDRNPGRTLYALGMPRPHGTAVFLLGKSPRRHSKSKGGGGVEWALGRAPCFPGV